MEEDYINVRTLLSAVDGLSLIDEDTGQLEALLNGEDNYPVTFPAALISFKSCDWQSFNGTDEQKGRGTFSIRLAFDCYDDTYEGAGQDGYATDRHTLRKAVHEAVHCKASVSGRPYIRTSSRTYTLPGRIKVYEQEYTYTVID